METYNVDSPPDGRDSSPFVPTDRLFLRAQQTAVPVNALVPRKRA